MILTLPPWLTMDRVSTVAWALVLPLFVALLFQVGDVSLALQCLVGVLAWFGLMLGAADEVTE